MLSFLSKAKGNPTLCRYAFVKIDQLVRCNKNRDNLPLMFMAALASFAKPVMNVGTYFSARPFVAR